MSYTEVLPMFGHTLQSPLSGQMRQNEEVTQYVILTVEVRQNELLIHRPWKPKDSICINAFDIAHSMN